MILLNLLFGMLDIFNETPVLDSLIKINLMEKIQANICTK